jgi:hypothetical protein
MNSVQNLLDTLGPPPAEVCLDWAWQLVKLADENSVSTPTSWDRVQIDSQGQLSLDLRAQSAEESQSSQLRMISELVQELIHWTTVGKPEVDNSQVASSPASRSAEVSHEQQATLKQLTDRLLGHNTVVESADVPKADESSTIFSSIDSQQDSTIDAQTVADDHVATTEPSKQDRTISEPQAALSKKRQSKKNNRNALWIGVSVVAGISACVLLFVFWPSSKDNNSSADKSLAINDNQAKQSTDSGKSSTKPKRKSKDQADSSNSIDDLLAPVDSSPVEKGTSNSGTSELGLSTGTSSSGVSTSEMSMANQSLKPSSETLSGLSTFSPGSAVDGNVAQSPTSTEQTSEADAQHEMNTEVPGATEDVTSIIAAAAKAELKVNNIDADVDDSGTPKLPVQLLDIDSMFQVQEITAKIRVKEPVWQLRIASTEEFNVEPAGLQSLAEKETVSWILTAKELKGRKDQQPTQVVVHAQLAGRRADIKWRIVAGCSDLPAIVVPLNEERLDAMLNMLQAYQLRLGTAGDQIKASVDLPGLPREQKSLLTAQRKAMENEGKLVVRARQIVADAGLFVSWMDRTLEVHGNLSDKVAGKTVTVLQLGEPEIESKEPANEPTEVDSSK